MLRANLELGKDCSQAPVQRRVEAIHSRIVPLACDGGEHRDRRLGHDEIQPGQELLGVEECVAEVPLLLALLIVGPTDGLD